MVNPTIASTRSGGPIAAAFATLRHLGDDGYLRLAVGDRRGGRRARGRGGRQCDGLRLLGEPRASTVVAFTSDDPALDLFVLADELTVRGLAHPAAARPSPICPGRSTSRSPLRCAPAPASSPRPSPRRRPRPAQSGRWFCRPTWSVSSAVSTGRPDRDLVASLAGALGIGGADQGPLPERQAMINTLLEAAPAPVREAMFAAFLSLLQRPTYG